MRDKRRAKIGFLELASGFGLARIWRTLNPSTVPVLALHGVLPDDEARLFNATGKFMSPAQIRRLLEKLSRISPESMCSFPWRPS